jgi:hypothetical protein
VLELGGPQPGPGLREVRDRVVAGDRQAVDGAHGRGRGRFLGQAEERDGGKGDNGEGHGRPEDGMETGHVVEIDREPLFIPKPAFFPPIAYITYLIGPIAGGASGRRASRRL